MKKSFNQKLREFEDQCFRRWEEAQEEKPEPDDEDWKIEQWEQMKADDKR